MKNMKKAVLVFVISCFWSGSSLGQVEVDEFAANMIGMVDVCKNIDGFSALNGFDREVEFLSEKFGIHENDRLIKELEKGKREVEEDLDFPFIVCGSALSFVMGTRAAVFSPQHNQATELELDEMYKKTIIEFWEEQNTDTLARGRTLESWEESVGQCIASKAELITDEFKKEIIDAFKKATVRLRDKDPHYPPTGDLTDGASKIYEEVQWQCMLEDETGYSLSELKKEKVTSTPELDQKVYELLEKDLESHGESQSTEGIEYLACMKDIIHLLPESFKKLAVKHNTIEVEDIPEEDLNKMMVLMTPCFPG